MDLAALIELVCTSDDPAACELAERVAAALKTPKRTVSAAFGLSRHGGVSPKRAADLEWRNAEIRDLARSMFPDLNLEQQARAVLAAQRRGDNRVKALQHRLRERNVAVPSRSQLLTILGDK